MKKQTMTVKWEEEKKSLSLFGIKGEWERERVMKRMSASVLVLYSVLLHMFFSSLRFWIFFYHTSINYHALALTTTCFWTVRVRRKGKPLWFSYYRRRRLMSTIRLYYVGWYKTAQEEKSEFSELLDSQQSRERKGYCGRGAWREVDRMSLFVSFKYSPHLLLIP